MTNNTNKQNDKSMHLNLNNMTLYRGLKLTLDAERYSFSPGDMDSILSISINASCAAVQCDAYFAFSIGDKQYLTFVTDLDGAFSPHGIQIFPQCEFKSIQSGNPSTLISSIPQDNTLTKADLRRALADGERSNWYRLTSSFNGGNFPIAFEFRNNYHEGAFTFKFSSPTFSGNNALECMYNSTVDAGEDFKLYITPDGGDETIFIETITVNGYDSNQNIMRRHTLFDVYFFS